MAEHSPEKAGVDSSILSLGTIIYIQKLGHIEIITSPLPSEIVGGPDL